MTRHDVLRAGTSPCTLSVGGLPFSLNCWWMLAVQRAPHSSCQHLKLQFAPQPELRSFVLVTKHPYTPKKLFACTLTLANGVAVTIYNPCNARVCCRCVVCPPEQATSWLPRCVDICSPQWVLRSAQAQEDSTANVLPRLVSMSADVARHLHRCLTAGMEGGLAVGAGRGCAARNVAVGRGTASQAHVLTLTEEGGAPAAPAAAARILPALASHEETARPSHAISQPEGCNGACSTSASGARGQGLGYGCVAACGVEAGQEAAGAERQAAMLGSQAGRQQLVRELRAQEGSRGAGIQALCGCVWVGG